MFASLDPNYFLILIEKITGIALISKEIDLFSLLTILFL